MKQVNKYNKFSYFVFIVLMIIFSACSKESTPSPDPVPESTTKEKLENKWIFESIIVYPTSALDPNGPSFFGMGGNGTDYFNFSSNGKVYVMMIGQLDSANYRFNTDSTVLMNQYYGGIATLVTDTIVIRTLTAKTLVFYTRNPAGEFGKFSFKR